jgi:hypothetical protein
VSKICQNFTAAEDDYSIKYAEIQESFFLEMPLRIEACLQFRNKRCLLKIPIIG